MFKETYHKNSIDIPSNVGEFVKDAKYSSLFRNNPNKRILDLANRCEGLSISWGSLHNFERSKLASESAILYRLNLN